MLRHFLTLCLKKAFRPAPEGHADFISILIASVAAADHYRPQWHIDSDAIAFKIVLLSAFFTFLLRLLFAPYFVWKEENDKNRALEDKYGDPRSPQKILGNKKTYSDAQRHALSDMFSETKAFFDVDIRAAESGFQDLVPQIWKITYIDSLEQFVRDARIPSNRIC